MLYVLVLKGAIHKLFKVSYIFEFGVGGQKINFAGLGFRNLNFEVLEIKKFGLGWWKSIFGLNGFRFWNHNKNSFFVRYNPIHKNVWQLKNVRFDQHTELSFILLSWLLMMKSNNFEYKRRNWIHCFAFFSLVPTHVDVSDLLYFSYIVVSLAAARDGRFVTSRIDRRFDFRAKKTGKRWNPNPKPTIKNHNTNTKIIWQHDSSSRRRFSVTNQWPFRILNTIKYLL